MMTPSLLFSLMLAISVAGTDSRIPYLDAVPIDASHARGQLLASAVRTADLGAEGLFVIERVPDAADRSPMVARIVRPDGTVSPQFRAADFLPADKVLPNSLGQIYAAAIIDDGEVLAVSIGWTNPKGRNINGIAILDRAARDWVPRRVIVLNGSVRDLASGPANTLFAVTTDVARSGAGEAVSLVTVLDSSGNFYGQLFPTTDDADAIEERGLHARLQRVGGDVVLLDAVTAEAMFITAAPARKTAPSRMDNAFIYPLVTRVPVDASVRTMNIRSTAPSLAGMKDVAIQDMSVGRDHSVTVLRRAFDGQKLHEFASVYRADGSISDWHGEVAWQYARVMDGTIEAVEAHPGSLFLVRTRLPQ